MPGILIDMTGERYGYLTVLEISDKKQGTHRFWKCKCDCGNIKYVLRRKLIDGTTKSCGCMKGKMISTNNTKHSGKGTRLYGIWTGMKTRIFNPNDHSYHKYGGNGLTMCDEWLDFAKFKEWAMGNGYSDELTIDRIDNSKGYHPDNCRWVDMVVQQNNRTNNVMCVYNGEKVPLNKLYKDLGISRYSCEKKYRRCE